jgi:hypothetical protein
MSTARIEQISFEGFESGEAANNGAAAADIAVVVPSLIASRRVIFIAFLMLFGDDSRPMRIKSQNSGTRS